MSTADFFLGIADALLDVVRPLEQAMTTADGFESLLVRYGWQTPADQTYIATVQNVFALTADIDAVVQLAEQIAADDDFTLEDAIKALELAIDIIQKVRALATAPPPTALPAPLNDPKFWPSFAGDLSQDLFAGYLQASQPTARTLARSSVSFSVAARGQSSRATTRCAASPIISAISCVGWSCRSPSRVGR